MAHVALVLGAGGLLGSAFHAGVLEALHQVSGWDARRAGLIVGTSAGANTAATLRAGLSPSDHAASASGTELSPEGRAIVDSVRTPLELGRVRAARSLRNGRAPRRPAAPRLVLQGVLSPGPVRPVVCLAGLLPRGPAPIGALAQRIRELHPPAWPEHPTWVCAVDTRTARRVVFGRDDVPVDHFGTAVAASSAIPGTFEPVRIGRTEYVDGGIHSTTNADLATGLGFDLVVVSAPMGMDGELRMWPPSSRAWHARTLAREVRRVRDHGTEVLVVQPTRAALAHFGADNMDGSTGPAVAEQAFRTTADLLASAAGRPARRILESAT